MTLFLVGVVFGVVFGLLMDHYFLPWVTHRLYRAQVAHLPRRSPRRRG